MIADLSLREPAIVAFCGASGSGKSAAAKVLCRDYGFVQIAFADALKGMCISLLGELGIDHAYITEPGLKNTAIPGLRCTGRQMLQRFGDTGRGIYPDFWADALERLAGLGLGQSPVHDRICIPDVRYPNEAKLVHLNEGVLVHLHREGAGLQGAEAAHSSEQHHTALGAQVGLVNNGPTLAGLEALVHALCEDLRLERREGCMP